MRVAALTLGCEPEAWRDLGFQVDTGGVMMLGPVRLELRQEAARGAIESWSLEGANVPESVDGLKTLRSERGGHSSRHPNGASAVDHVVVLTPSLERTTAAFARIGVDRRRVREAAGGVRQGFFLVGDVLVEVVEGTGLQPEQPARFWGLTIVVEDLDAAAKMLEGRIGQVKRAVQPGRRIATMSPEATGGLPLALITPRQS